jgi:hypothetical protein
MRATPNLSSVGTPPAGARTAPTRDNSGAAAVDDVSRAGPPQSGYRNSTQTPPPARRSHAWTCSATGSALLTARRRERGVGRARRDSPLSPLNAKKAQERVKLFLRRASLLQRLSWSGTPQSDTWKTSGHRNGSVISGHSRVLTAQAGLRAQSSRYGHVEEKNPAKPVRSTY